MISACVFIRKKSKKKMADNDSIVYPDEVDKVKEEAAKLKNDGASETDPPPEIGLRNMITVPDNCPPGFQRDADGVCREVWD